MTAWRRRGGIVEADKLVGHADKGDVYTPAMEAAVKDVPQLGSSGDLSMEIVLDAAPDLVFGTASSTINPDSLSAVGIPMLNPSGYCGSSHGPGKGDGDIDFDDVYSDVELYGRIFATEDVAAKAVADYRQRVAAVRERFRDAPKRTAADYRDRRRARYSCRHARVADLYRGLRDR